MRVKIRQDVFHAIFTGGKSFVFLCIFSSVAAASDSHAVVSQQSKFRPDGSADIPAFNLPLSSFVSSEARQYLIKLQTPNLVVREASQRDVAAFRKAIDEESYLPLVAKQQARYRVHSHPEVIGGVYTEVFSPKAGEAKENRSRVLINLHGGGFIAGGRSVGQIESIPVAHIARIKVISIDYRMAPEYTFPAASEDVAAVYRELLKQYKPQNIGIYGCSAGGFLTGQAVAWFLKEKLPTPGAIGVFCAATSPMGGDSARLNYMLTGAAPENLIGKFRSYFEGVNREDPLVTPSVSAAVLSQFPPTLFLTGSRSFEMSAALKSQLDLTLAGVEAKLSVWDGMTHAFFYDPELPESREAYQIMARFFNDYLGKRRATGSE